MGDFVDFVVRQIYSDARRDPSRAVSTPELAKALIGPHAIHRVSNGLSFEGCSENRVRGRQIVMHIPSSLAAWQINHRVSRQLVRWYLARHAYEGAQVDSVVRRVAAAVCVPTPALERARTELGEVIPALGEHFRVSQSLMALRLAECLGYPTALRTENQIIVRGSHWDWPNTEAGWAVLFRRARAIGLIVQHLNDVRGRVVLRAR
jgi:hypothetical protein